MPRQEDGVSFTPQWNFLGTGDNTTLQVYNPINNTFSVIPTGVAGAANPSGYSVVDLHYGISRGLGLDSSAATGQQTFDIASSSAAGATTITLTANASHETGDPLVVDELIVYQGDDGYYYTAKVVSIASAVLTLGAPLEAAVSAGADKVSNFYINESHPTAYGYAAMADYIVTKTKAQYQIDSRFQLNTVFGSGTVVIEPSNSINNTGSSTVSANTITSPTGLTDGVQASFSVSSTGAYMLRFVINTLGNDVKITLTYDGIDVEATINQNEPSLFEFPFWVSSDTATATLTLAAVSNGDNFIVNQDIPVLKVIGLAPNLNSGTQVCLGDSWFAQYYLWANLVTRLPGANIINKGVGGNTAQDLIDRFDTDVTPYNPSIVYIVVGTNDYYGGVTNDVFSNNINQLKSMCFQIGAYPIILTSSVGSAELTSANFIRSREYANWTKYYDETIGGQFVPYSGALSDVNLGSNKLITSGGINISGTGTDGRLSYNASLGIIQTGKTGSTNDWAILTPAGASVISNPTGTNDIEVDGDISANNLSGTNTGDDAPNSTSLPLTAGSGNVLTGALYQKGNGSGLYQDITPILGTGFVYGYAHNTSGGYIFGLEGSAGGEVQIGTDPYSVVVGTDQNKPFHISTNNTVRATFSGAGALRLHTYGAGILQTDASGNVTASGSLASGQYTPTATNTANITTSTPEVCNYFRVGNAVTVSGRIEVSATVAATFSTLRLTLPIASNLANAYDLTGIGGNPAASSDATKVTVIADTTNDAATISFLSGVSTGPQNIYFTFTYQVL